MYHGEVNVAQEDLNNFLQVAEELKVKGLTQNGSEQEKRSSSNEVKHRAPSQPIKPPPPMKMAPRVAAPVVPSIQDTEDDIQEVEAEVKTEPGASGVMEQYQGAHEMAGAATYEEGYEYGDFGEQESYVMDTADQEKGEREQNTLGMMKFNCIMPWEISIFVALELFLWSETDIFFWKALFLRNWSLSRHPGEPSVVCVRRILVRRVLPKDT